MRLPALAALAGVMACLIACAVAPGAAVARPRPHPLTLPDASGISVQGSELLSDGQPYVPRGLQITGLVAPPENLTGKYVAAGAAFGPGEISYIVDDHANLVRIQVSEFGLAPGDPLYDPNYMSEVVSGVELARSYGLNVIVSLQAEAPTDNPTRCNLPDAEAATDWSELAEQFAGDDDVMFELYNEPGLAATAANWRLWLDGGPTSNSTGGSCTAVGVQTLVNEIRATGANNVIILPGLSGEQSLGGVPHVTDPEDPSDPQLAYGIHYPNLTQESTEWDTEFGNAAEYAPVIITEWYVNSAQGGGCTANTPQAATLLMDYLASKRIGLVGFAIDEPGTIVADFDNDPTTYDNFQCGVAGDGPGQLVFDDYAGEAQAAVSDGAGGVNSYRAWMTDVGTLTRLQALDAPLVTGPLNTPLTYVTGATAPELLSLGLTNAVPTAVFTSETALAQATATGSLPAGTGAVELALGSASPAGEQSSPLITFELAAQAAHRNGLLLIADPETSLLARAAPKTTTRDLDIAFLKRPYIADAATYANAIVLPFGDSQSNPTAYAALADAAATQADAIHPGIELMDGLNVTGTTPPPATTLTSDVVDAGPYLAGYSLTDLGGPGDTDALGLLSALYGPNG